MECQIHQQIDIARQISLAVSDGAKHANVEGSILGRKLEDLASALA
jgi:hypothetical protein